MECIRCKALNPDGQKCCGECGASLDPRSGPSKELFELLLREQIAAAIQEQFKNQKVVENELTESVIKRLSDWGKFYVGIPLAILLVALSFKGYEKLSDLDKLVKATEDDVVKPELKDIQRQAENIKKQTDDLKTQADNRKAELENIYDQRKKDVANLEIEGGKLKATFKTLESQASHYAAATQKINEAAIEAQSATAKAADVENKFRTLATGLGCTTLAPLAVSCSLPFESIQRRHPIDSCCGLSGTNKPGTPQAMQDLAKNNFCPNGTPINVDFEVLRQLQQDAANPGRGITFGSASQLPNDRSVLRNLPTKAGSLSEGAVVRLTAFVIDAHYSNVSTGESVNCRQLGIENNDIHVALGQNSNKDDPCSSVTAEISPHFRPDVWNPDNLNKHDAHLFRFTGQLFFDASHRPCVGGAAGPNPKRVSVWEIHPVYAVDICVDPNNNCKGESDQNWVALSDFVGTGTSNSETRLFLPDDISKQFGYEPATLRKLSSRY